MISKRNLVIVALAIFCVIVTLFMVVPVSQSEPPSGTYYNWADLNDDGAINILESIIIGNHFLTYGTPINNRSALLDFQSQIDALNATVFDLKSTINNMNATIAELQNANAMLNASLVAQSAKIDNLNNTVSFLVNARNNTLVMVWDSGWHGPMIVGDTDITYGETLDITNVVVEMIGRETLTGASHIIDFGGYQYADYHGAYWYKLTPTSITFHRHGQDTHWVYVRITIWQIVRL